MQRKLRNAGLLVTVLALAGVVFAGCVDEPNPPVIDKVTASVRFVHAVSDAPAVDIWVDGNRVAESQTFKAATAYLTINAGDRFIRVTPAGQDTSKAVFRQKTSIRSYTQMTMVFYGLVADASVAGLLTQERFTYSDETAKVVDSADVKVINVNAGLTPVTLVSDTGAGLAGPQLIGPVAASSNSVYKRLKAQAYKFMLGANGLEVKSKDFTLQAKYRYTFVLVGSAATPENSEILTLQDDPH